MNDFLINYNTITMDDCCKNCIYCAEVKKWPTYSEVATKICLYFVCTEDSKYILEVHDNDKCEVFRHKDY